LHESCAVTQLLLDQNTLDCHCWPTIGLPHRVSSSCFVSPESADGLARKQVVGYATVRGTEENPYLANPRASLFPPSSEGEERKKSCRTRRKQSGYKVLIRRCLAFYVAFCSRLEKDERVPISR
jgi:hypothetical protein